MSINQINLNLSKINIPDNIKAEFSKAKSGRDVRVSLIKGAKSVVGQAARYGAFIPPIKPILPMIKTSLENAGMGAEAAEVVEAAVVAEEATVVGETLTLSAEATELMTVAEVGGGAITTSTPGGPGVVTVVVVVVVVVAVAWWIFHSNVSPDKKFLLNAEFRRLLGELKGQMKKAQ